MRQLTYQIIVTELAEDSYEAKLDDGADGLLCGTGEAPILAVAALAKAISEWPGLRSEAWFASAASNGLRAELGMRLVKGEAS